MPEKSILITGCSSGIGLCAATQLKARGYRVFATARKPADLEKLNSLGLEAIPLELNDSTSIQRAVDMVLQRTGGTLDALFNNSGFLVAGAVEDLTRDMERLQFETNVFGPIELTRLLLPVMRKQGHGRIIFNSSILGVITLPYYGAYNASKFALEGFARTLRQELLNTDIQVSIINPGPIRSSLRQHAFEYYQQTLQPVTNSAYQDIYQKLEHTYFSPKRKESRLTSGPEMVVKKLIHALEATRPHVHYFIGLPAQALAFIRRLLPDKALDWLLSKVN
jgi:NAD(P)-dependent dehydrogenase (short-subunit alcohol dehydrogenase family)